MAANRLIWIDLEMTGLDVHHDQIIEIATIVTDDQLNIVAEGPSIAIKTSDEALAGMGEWCQQHHGQSGLTERVKQSQIDLKTAEAQTVAFLAEHLEKGQSPMCGNSITLDRQFIERDMPTLASYFHYRQLDVSTVKELMKRWAPEGFKAYQKESSHLALEDIKDSIEELKFYRANFFRVETTGTS